MHSLHSDDRRFTTELCVRRRHKRLPVRFEDLLSIEGISVHRSSRDKHTAISRWQASVVCNHAAYFGSLGHPE